MAEGNVIEIQSLEEFENYRQKSIDDKKLVVVYFTAQWCGPCRMVAPSLNPMSDKFNQVIFLKVDIDLVQEVARKYDISAVPAFVLLLEGNEVSKITGLNMAGLEQKIIEYTDSVGAAE